MRFYYELKSNNKQAIFAMNNLLNSFTTVILAILAGSVFIAAVVVGIWAAIEKLIKGR